MYKIFEVIFYLSLFLGLLDIITPKTADIGFNGYINHSHYIVVDFSKPSDQKRLFIYDSQTNTVLYSTYVAHGKGSGKGRYATRFSNKPNSWMSSLGIYRLGETYQGRHGVSIRLDGLSSTNSNVRFRNIVIHSARYIGDGKTGHSEGCFAVPINAMPEILRLTSEGMLLYAKE